MKILIVEDEPLLRDGLVDLLEGAGHEVVAVGDGLAGAERGASEPFDMVILDWMLPRLEGPRCASACAWRGRRCRC